MKKDNKNLENEIEKLKLSIKGLEAENRMLKMEIHSHENNEYELEKINKDYKERIYDAIYLIDQWFDTYQDGYECQSIKDVLTADYNLEEIVELYNKFS